MTNLCMIMLRIYLTKTKVELQNRPTKIYHPYKKHILKTPKGELRNNPRETIHINKDIV